MYTFEFNVIETTNGYINVTAKNYAEAEELARELCYEGRHVHQDTDIDLHLHSTTPVTEES